MDVAEMKVAGSNKGAAKVDTSVAKGAALAHVMVEYAWKCAEEVEKRQNKLAMFVKDICALDAKGHQQFRAQLSAELAAIREMEKNADVKESTRAGYSLNSFVVMVSNWRAISEAAQIGFKGVDKAGDPLPWTVALETARDYRKSHASANGTVVRTAAGKKAGAGRKAISDYDRALNAAAKLQRKDQRKLFEALGAMLGATISYPPKASTKQAAETLAATVH
jgi:hypothetical protein